MQKPVSINQHDEFLESLLRPADYDDLDGIILQDPYVPNAPGRRSDKDLGHLLNILDELEGVSNE